MNRLIFGILAHVDAGKTTLSEGLMYKSGAIRKIGRVDNKDAHLDTNELERARGITIFSSQAELKIDDLDITLLDTPGHVDFSAEMERTLRVLDYAILIISGADGVQGHTETLWKLLREYNVPVFIFVNKMDQNGTDKEKILEDIREKLTDSCVDFTDTDSEEFYENIAMSDEHVMEDYLDNMTVSIEDIQGLIVERKIFPCFFGSALRLTGIDEFMQGLYTYTLRPEYSKEFGARVYKITREADGTRLTHIKVTGGTLRVKTELTGDTDGREWREKINQIRLYSGDKYETVNEACAGMVCALTGLNYTYCGEGFGYEYSDNQSYLEPVLTYKINLPDSISETQMLPKLRMLEEEDPKLSIVWDEELKEIQAKIMGEVQLEILKSVIKERFGVDITFGAGNIVYKETIENVVEGVGHFEPLRHYAEVHLILEPAPRGSGVHVYTDCSEDILDKNWQRLIVTHIEEREHRGVLTGSPVTDINIILVTGRAHIKHTEGGDFRQATYRAIRQGLKMAKSRLLEPYYEFRLEVPEVNIGRAMMDIEKMHGKFEMPVTSNGMAVITGSAPVSLMHDYQNEVIAYSKGHGRLNLTLKGYDLCHNEDEVIAKYNYDSESDIANPTGSVFCAHGSGYLVPWNEVYSYMHVESVLAVKNKNNLDIIENNPLNRVSEGVIDLDEIDDIINKTFFANRGASNAKWRRNKRVKEDMEFAISRDFGVKKNVKNNAGKEKYLLIDGYNVIFAWDELNELAKTNIDGARDRLLDIMCNYQGVKKCNLIVVFDAYRVENHKTEFFDYHNIHVVYTKEAETADQYIEKFAHENGRRYDVTVVTSDGLEQIIIQGQGCTLISAREFKEYIKANDELIKEKTSQSVSLKNGLFTGASDEVKNFFLFLQHFVSLESVIYVST
ncbi:TetM/TetW/TetO/TetS family tetracycline resistance ribosomal protection protein [Falcatimonas sp. MSJ-15]|uniref:translation factor GTPase family protein n=1 Tax=Falcatimonas sp. MSJ-15 TaxID=2841515 RepID=UPI001C0FB7B9|nr:TetM/TetW/TetO/TetS family tetracycline resistance ribosomal protection protein [Falcatimonas sp. MSJ-15]MBU5469947.1 TetM/TetW/TetO/TetS family tetracycline resistance ribosomal protection protein [Falcatimonas sp. MSJ-15]